MKPRIPAASFAVNLISFLCSPLLAQQFQPCGSNICASSNANVGIGTSNPSQLLSVAGNGEFDVNLTVGNNPSADQYPAIFFGPGGSSTAILQSVGSQFQMFQSGTLGAVGLSLGYLSVAPMIYDGGSAANLTRIDPDAGSRIFQFNSAGTLTNFFQSQGPSYINGGNVGIGTTNPQHLLHVAGTIGAEEVTVSSTGADYVFDPDYRLTPLTKVGEYIQANHHLPEIPSAKEMEEKGVSIGEMQSKLLAKIEELTLHMIRLDRENEDLRSRNRRLEERMTEMEKAR